MIISSATPQELVDWFHGTTSSMELLCVLLAPSSDDQKKLSEMIASPFAADAALGEEIGFLLLHPLAKSPIGLDHGLGKYSALCGELIVGDRPKHSAPFALRDTSIFRDLSNEGEPYQREIASQAAKAMSRFVPEFEKLFCVSAVQFPALCIVVKGVNQSIVLPAINDWKAEDLLNVIIEVRSISDEIWRARRETPDLLGGVAQRLALAKNGIRELRAKSEKIADILERILRTHSATDSDREKVALFLATEQSNASRLGQTLDRLSFSESAKFLGDGQRKKVLDLMHKVDDVREKLSDELASRPYLLTVVEQANEIKRRREALFEAIRSRLRGGRFVSTSSRNDDDLQKVRPILELLKLSAEIGAILGRGIEWILRTGTPPK